MTTISKSLVAIAAVSLFVAVPSAHAQRRGGNRGGSSRGTAVPRSGGPVAGAPRGGVYAAPRYYGQRYSGPTYYGSRYYGSRYSGSRYYGSRYYGSGYYAPRYYGGGFYRPYYAFRPRLSLGFGLWVGYPIAFPYYYGGYYNPYYYGAYPPPYGYSTAYPGAYPPPSSYPDPSGSVGVQRNTGGLSFEISPDSAEVFVDGSYVGTVGEFTPTSQPLDLTPGRHRVEIRAPGYRTMSFDADIIAGQVIPYQGALEQ